MKPTPILLIAFSRPNTLMRQLQRIELLPNTDVMISIDGPLPQTRELRDSTLLVAERWANTSHHRVSIVNQQKNLGIYDHLPKAMELFYSSHNFGAILEDDIEFTPALFDIFNLFKERVISGEFWSICGHNPQSVGDPNKFKGNSMQVYPSNFHSIWGWGTSADNAAKFLSHYGETISMSKVDEVLSDTARAITRDLFLQRAFILTWKRKLEGFNSRRIQSGWDTRWVFEAWSQESLSLIPEFSLSREELSQIEGQTHPHSKSGDTWKLKPEKEIRFHLVKIDKNLDVALLSTWGIRRKYAWLFFLRIFRQLKEVTK